MALTKVQTEMAGTGAVLQVVSATLVGSANVSYFSTTTNGVVDTGFSATITPKSATSKILVLISPCLFVTGPTVDSATGVGIKRGSSNIFLTSRISNYAGITGGGFTPFISYLDSPVTTSPTTYMLQVDRYQNNGGTTVYLNRNYQTTDYSTIVLMEIAG